ncbi:MAG: hypothetical protein GF388_10400 [Candidatus Aegiribacteria sp.]|nr:hypothetical protein [Candidatus Aegiribacteria sp.]MBD3295434.1 hypothetical protein [Candidatus Fermentibacteria bacterium]
MISGCNGRTLAGNETETAGVDSMFISVNHRILVVRVFSTRGIGSLRTVLHEPVFAETVQFRFYYAEGRPYASCENLNAIIQGVESEEQVQLQSGSYGFVNGTIGVSAGIEVEAIDVSWIDYYRD